MIKVLEPENALLKKFVESIYVLRNNADKMEFTAYPSIYTPVALLRNAAVECIDNHVLISQANDSACLSIACNQYYNATHVQYKQMVDEIAINFKPLGLPSFTHSKHTRGKNQYFHDWDDHLPCLFNDVFEPNKPESQLQIIETFLLERYRKLTNETILFNMLDLFGRKEGFKMQAVADILGIHYKRLYRDFLAAVGCSPAHYRKLLKFRESIITKLKEGDNTRLTDICYRHNYTDQSYFIKQYKELTGENPGHFFKSISSFGNGKVVVKIYKPV